MDEIIMHGMIYQYANEGNNGKVRFLSRPFKSLLNHIKS